jgi:hypothetical protein
MDAGILGMNEKQVRERLGPPDDIVGRGSVCPSGTVKDDRPSCGLPLNGGYGKSKIPLILGQVWYRGARAEGGRRKRVEFSLERGCGTAKDHARIQRQDTTQYLG